MTKKELIEKLTGLKKDVRAENRDKTITNVINLLADYDDEDKHESTSLYDDFAYRFTSVDTLEEYIKSRLREYWVSQVAKDLKDVESDSNYYKVDDVFGDVSDVDDDDVKDWIDEIIDELKD